MNEIPADVAFRAIAAWAEIAKSDSRDPTFDPAAVIARAIWEKVAFYRSQTGAVRVNDSVIVVSPHFPPHVWDGEKMTPMEIGLDFSKGPVKCT